MVSQIAWALARIVVQHVVPKLLEVLIDDKKVPSVTEGMVRDYEEKVALPVAKRNMRDAARKLRRMRKEKHRRRSRDA